MTAVTSTSRKVAGGTVCSLRVRLIGKLGMEPLGIAAEL